MRVMVFVKAGPDSEAGVMPAEDLFREMSAFNQQLVDAGVLKAGDGLKPSRFGKRIRFDGEERAVIDGPFAETKELVAGFWIWEVASMDEAVEWARKCPHPSTGNDLALELRPFYEMEDFGEFLPADVAEQEDRMRRQVEG